MNFDNLIDDSERIQNLIDVIKYAEENGNPLLSDSLVMWKKQLKELKSKSDMKWISIGDEIDPPFSTKLLVCVDHRMGNYFFARLHKIEINSGGKEYIWDIHASQEIKELVSDGRMKVKHWCLVTDPN